VFRGRAEQPLETTQQVGRFADVRLRSRVVAAKKKNSRRGWNHSEGFSITVGNEFEAAGKHRIILVRLCRSVFPPTEAPGLAVLALGKLVVEFLSELCLTFRA